MLELLEKRSGEIEPFQASKTNGWVLFVGRDILDRMDWSSIVIQARNQAPTQMTSQEWQLSLINLLKVRGSQDDGWPYMLMGGRLYTIYQMKKIHGDTYPKLKDLTKSLIEKNIVRDMGYTDEEMDYLDQYVMNHEMNMSMAWTQVEQYNLRYSLKNRVTGEAYETPQFAHMRMAMAVCEHLNPDIRISEVTKMYQDLCDDILNPPSPNYAALGTTHYGMASCCLIAAADDAESIQIAGVISYSMTLASGGLGMHLSTRAPGDPVDGGRVMHAGRLNYIRKLIGDTTANKQGARGGAITFFDTIYSPEMELNAMMQNPRTPVELRERRLNMSYQTNPFFTRKAARDENYFTFSSYTAPDLYSAFFKADQTEFETLYAKYEADPGFKKNYRSAKQDLGSLLMGQEIEQSTLFWMNPAEANRHGSYTDTCIQTNLCHEVINRTAPWFRMEDLFDPEGDPTKGEVGICNIGSIPVHRLPFNPSNPKLGMDRYKRAIRSMMNIIDYAIDNSEYHFPAIRTQARSRRNCSVGMTGIATLFAKLNLKFNTPEGRRALHVLSERHMYACIEVALEMGIERGNAPWINGPKNDGVDGTRWVNGWMPIDTAKKAFDHLFDTSWVFDWENLRGRVVENKGIRFSSLVAHMPGEQSTRKGNGSNSVYPVTGLSVDLSDGSSAMPWAALDNDLIGHQYQTAYELSDEDQAIHYGIIQRTTDQAISADSYHDHTNGEPITIDRMIQRHINRVKYGWKTSYYMRSLTQQGGKQKNIEIKEDIPMITAQAESVMDRIAAQAKAMQSDVGLSCTIDGNCGT